MGGSNMSRTVIYLSKKELNRLYPLQKQSNPAKLTRDFIEKGYKIVCIKQTGLSKKTEAELIECVKKALIEEHISLLQLEFGGFSDKTKLKHDTIYVAYKVSRKLLKAQ